jgi:hypothetical protein
MRYRYLARAVIAFSLLTWDARPAAAQGVVMEGTLDCGMWVKARNHRTADNLEHYLVGLLNGMVLGSAIEFWRAGGTKVSREQIFLWMDNYCRSTPLSDVIVGAVALMNERTHNAWAIRKIAK